MIKTAKGMKRLELLLVCASLICLGAGVGFGLVARQSATPEIAADLSSKDAVELYNAGVKAFSESEPNASENYFLNLLEVEPLGDLAAEGFFNLGYLYASRGEREASSDNLGIELKWLKKSKAAFAGLLSLEIEEDEKLIDDARINLGAVQKKIADLMAKIDEKQREELREKTEYELVTLMEKNQKEIQKLIAVLSKQKDLAKRLETREALSQKRQEGVNILKELFARFQQDFGNASTELRSFSI